MESGNVEYNRAIYGITYRSTYHISPHGFDTVSYLNITLCRKCSHLSKITLLKVGFTTLTQIMQGVVKNWAKY